MMVNYFIIVHHADYKGDMSGIYEQSLLNHCLLSYCTTNQTHEKNCKENTKDRTLAPIDIMTKRSPLILYESEN